MGNWGLYPRIRDDPPSMTIYRCLYIWFTRVTCRMALYIQFSLAWKKLHLGHCYWERFHIPTKNPNDLYVWWSTPKFFFQPKQLIIWVPGMSIIYRNATISLCVLTRKAANGNIWVPQNIETMQVKGYTHLTAWGQPRFFYQQNIESSEALETNFGMS